MPKPYERETPSSNTLEAWGARLKDFVAEYGRGLVVVAVVAVLLAALWSWSVASRRARDERAWTMLSSAASPADLENVLREYPGAAAEPWIMVELANRHAQEKRSKEAREIYEKFLTRFPGHYLASFVEEALAVTLADLKEYDAALGHFERVIALGRAFQAPQAWWHVGRVREEKGNADGAKKAYAKVLELEPEGFWGEMARFRMEGRKGMSAAPVEKPVETPVPVEKPVETPAGTPGTREAPVMPETKAVTPAKPVEEVVPPTIEPPKKPEKKPEAPVKKPSRRP